MLLQQQRKKSPSQFCVVLILQVVQPHTLLQKQWLSLSTSSAFQSEDTVLIHNHNKSEVWQLMQLMPSAICSLLSTNCHPMSGRNEKKKSEAALETTQIYSPEQQGNLKSAAADFAGHKESYSSFRNCFLTSAVLLRHRVAVSTRVPEQTSGSGNCFFCSDFHPPTFPNQRSDKWKSLLKAALVQLSDFKSKLSRYP